MRFKIVILLVIFSFCISSFAFAVSPQKKVFGNTIVETGTSTENIMPLLANIAGRQGAYFERIYGQHRAGYILILLNSNGKIDSVEKLYKITDMVFNNVTGFYSSSEGKIEFVPSQQDFWDSVVLEFKDGKFTNKKIMPSREMMEDRASLRGKKIKSSHQEKLVCDLDSGTVNGVKIGISMSTADVIALMGKNPEDTEYSVYSYYKDGIEFGFSEKSGQSHCYAITIYLNDTKQEIPFTNKTLFYKGFKGDVVPLNKRENIKVIREKFGNPDDFMAESFDGSPRITYNTSYGNFYIFFDKKGIVDVIDLRSK
ncbi:hypothetical protein ACFL2G_03840 [Candidatus Omnitrophota bacterium]